MSESTLTAEDLTRSAERLAESTAGRSALRIVVDLLEGEPLDGRNQNAVLTLLAGAWGPLAGSARDAIRTALKG